MRRMGDLLIISYMFYLTKACQDGKELQSSVCQKCPKNKYKSGDAVKCLDCPDSTLSNDAKFHDDTSVKSNQTYMLVKLTGRR